MSEKKFNEAESASEGSKAFGFRLNEMSNASEVSRHTLGIWFKTRRKVFRLICLGMVKDREIKNANS